MSKHTTQCQRGHWYNTKFHVVCPRCGGRPVFASEQPPSPESLKALQERFNGTA